MAEIKSTWLQDTAKAFESIPIDAEGIHVQPFLDACKQIHPVYDIVFSPGIVANTLKGDLTKHLDSVTKRFQESRPPGWGFMF